MRRAHVVLSVCSLVVSAVACGNERRAKHEALAKTLEPSVSLLCKTAHPEAGGCVGDCAVRAAALEGKAARDAADGLAALATFSDPETEGMLAEVRKSARALRSAYGDACKESLAGGADPNALEVQRCADARKQFGWNLSELRTSVDHMTSTTEARTGASMPKPTPDGCAKLAK